MKKIATGTLTALLIPATTSLAMARGYYDYYGGYGYGSEQYNTSPASNNAGIEQER
jgi:hypothetical protein